MENERDLFQRQTEFNHRGQSLDDGEEELKSRREQLERREQDINR